MSLLVTVSAWLLVWRERMARAGPGDSVYTVLKWKSCCRLFEELGVFTQRHVGGRFLNNRDLVGNDVLSGVVEAEAASSQQLEMRGE